MSGTEWRTIEHQGQPSKGRILRERGEWSIVVIPDQDKESDTVVYLKNDTVVSTEAYGAPNAGDVTVNGIAVIADWKVFGERTNTDIHLVDIEGDMHRTLTVEQSSPLVGISNNGEYIAVADYDEMVKIYEMTDLTRVGKHSVLFGDRIVPSAAPGAPDQFKLAGPNSEEDLYYLIDVNGDVQSTSEQIKDLRYIESFELDHSSDWNVAISELLEYYDNTENEYLKEQIPNVIGDGSLAKIKNISRLESIVDSLHVAHDRFPEPKNKLAAALISDAHYRIGREHEKEGDIDSFFENMDAAQSYAEVVLPWYDGKKLLAKIHRRLARVYKRRGDRPAARENVDRIFELEQEYDISLASDADERLREELAN
jgi:hypothetical protein